MEGRIAVLASVLALTPACTVLETYPSAQTENCTNGVDDDFDGLLDCEDTDCQVPACPEEDLAHCTNGRDDDGDGRPDWSDPRCWLLASTRVTRCPNVTAADVSYDPTIAAWQSIAASIDPVIREMMDPVHGGSTMVGVTGGTPGGTEAWMSDLRIIPGLWRGTVVTSRVYLSMGGVVTLSLNAAADVTFSPGAQGIFTLRAENRLESVSPPPLAGRDGWFTLSIQVDDAEDGFVRISADALSDLDRTHQHGELMTTIPWPLSGGISPALAFSNMSTDSIAAVGTLHVVRAGGRQCNAGSPEVRLLLQSAASNGTLLCATGLSLNALPVVWRSDNPTPTPLVLPSTAEIQNDPPAISWDEERHVFRGILPHGSDSNFTIVESSDCVTWTEIGHVFDAPPTDPAFIPGVADDEPYYTGYEIASHGHTHEFWSEAMSASGDRLLYFATSTMDGAPGSFTQARTLSIVPPPGASFPTARWMARVARIGGDDHVLVLNVITVPQQPSAPQYADRLFVETAHGLSPVPLTSTNTNADSIVFGPAILVERSFDATHFSGWLVEENARLGTMFAPVEIAPTGSCHLNVETCNTTDDDCDGMVDEDC